MLYFLAKVWIKLISAKNIFFGRVKKKKTLSSQSNIGSAAVLLNLSDKESNKFSFHAIFAHEFLTISHSMIKKNSLSSMCIHVSHAWMRFSSFFYFYFHRAQVELVTRTELQTWNKKKGPKQDITKCQSVSAKLLNKKVFQFSLYKSFLHKILWSYITKLVCVCVFVYVSCLEFFFLYIHIYLSEVNF